MWHLCPGDSIHAFIAVHRELIGASGLLTFVPQRYLFDRVLVVGIAIEIHLNFPCALSTPLPACPLFRPVRNHFSLRHRYLRPISFRSRPAAVFGGGSGHDDVASSTSSRNVVAL